MTNPAIALESGFRHLGFGFLSSFDLRHSSFDSRFKVQCIRKSDRRLSMNLGAPASLPAGCFAGEDADTDPAFLGRCAGHAGPEVGAPVAVSCTPNYLAQQTATCPCQPILYSPMRT
jgi:hypothetical protein